MSNNYTLWVTCKNNHSQTSSKVTVKKKDNNEGIFGLFDIFPLPKNAVRCNSVLRVYRGFRGWKKKWCYFWLKLCSEERSVYIHSYTYDQCCTLNNCLTIINTKDINVAVYFCGIDYHLSALLLTPGASHGHVFIFAQKFKFKTP